MDREKLLDEINTIVGDFNEKICTMNLDHDKKEFTFRHLLIIQRKFFIDLSKILTSLDVDSDKIIIDLNRKISDETEKIIANITNA